MSRCTGVTEQAWASLSESQRHEWSFYSKIIATVAAFFVVNSGTPYFDWSLRILSVLFIFALVDTQRSYSKLKPKLRKRKIRIAVAIGSSVPAILGLTIFGQVALASLAQVVRSFATSNASFNETTATSFIVAFLIATPMVFVSAFRQLNMVELIYHVPRRELMNLLIFKRLTVNSFIDLARFELFSLGTCLLFASAAASEFNMIKTLIIKLA